MSKGWDNTMLKKLKALTGKGLSTSEIGKRLGMSKNAIVGKLNRLGWNAKAGGAANAKIEEIKHRALYDTGITPEYGQQLLTLSTCYGATKSDRIIVIGVETNQ